MQFGIRVGLVRRRFFGQADALELARGALGNFVQEQHLVRHLEVGESGRHEVADVPFGGGLAVAQHHRGGDILAEFVVGHGEGHHLGHCRVVHEHLVDLAR